MAREGDQAMNPLAITIRTKKLGVLLQDGRLAANKSILECAQAINVTPDVYQAFENGDTAPTLPEVELLAFYLDIPLDHFWGNTSLSESGSSRNAFNVHRLIEIRQKFIGVALRQAREQAGLSLEDAGQTAGFSADEIEALELGEKPIPLPVLEFLSSYYHLQIKDLQDTRSPVGVKATERLMVQEFLSLPADIQSFVAKPINRPYLELAQRLSEMSVEKLRAVGEGILEITL